jgi:hypothetical protein
MKTLRILLLSLVPCVVAHAQQDPNTYLSPYANPALLLSNHRLQAEVNQSWTEGGGFTNGYASLELKRPCLGIGILLVRSEFGKYIMESIRLDLAYRFNIGEHTLIPGVYVGMKAFSYGQSIHPLSDNGARSESAIVPDVGVGVQYRFRKLIFAISAGNLNRGEWEYGEPFYGRRQEAIVNTFLHSVLSYDFEVGRYFRIKPVTIFRWTPTKTANYFSLGDHLVLGVDNISKVLTRINIGVGVHWSRSDISSYAYDRLIISPQLCFKWFSIGYSTRMPLQDIHNSQNHVHQFSFRVHLFPSHNEKAVVSGADAGAIQ